MKNRLPIGVFDSGVGGLTVLRALRECLPHEDMLYLGDTARLPYGTKSAATVTRYALQAAGKLVERNVKLLVIACNTATASGLGALQQAWPELTVVGVIEPGAKAACAASVTGKIAVIGTESTIKNEAYQKAIRAINPAAEVHGQACSLLVPLAEEGWISGEIIEAVAKRYLRPLFDNACAAESTAGSSATDNADGASGSSGFNALNRPDTIVLGCTHFPPFAPAIAKVVGSSVALVDSAATTAKAVEDALTASALLNPQSSAGKLHFMTTDDVQRFARTGSLFLGHELREEDVELVNL